MQSKPKLCCSHLLSLSHTHLSLQTKIHFILVLCSKHKSTTMLIFCFLSMRGAAASQPPRCRMRRRWDWRRELAGESIRLHIPGSRVVGEGKDETKRNETAMRTLQPAAPYCPRRSWPQPLTTFGCRKRVQLLVPRIPCESTAPTPESEASTSTMNWWPGSGWERMGAEVRSVFSLEKAVSASSPHGKVWRVEVRRVRGAATLL